MERPTLIKGEPGLDLFAFDRVPLGEQCERHQAPALRSKPTPPVRAAGVADVGYPGIGIAPVEWNAAQVKRVLDRLI